MIDFLLRDPADLLPRQGRAVVVAAGNDRVKGWHGKVRVLRQAAPLRTQLLWAVEPGDDDVNELHLWHSGLDRIRVRLIAPVAAGNRITQWVAPSGAADAVEQAEAGTFAPNAAGPAPQLDFNFANGGRGTFIQRAEPVNGDRQIVIRIENA